MTRSLWFVTLAGCGGGGTLEVAGDDLVVTPTPEGDADADSDSDSDADTDTDPEGLVWPDGLDVRVCADGSADHDDIQPAIDAAAAGDVIGVCRGTYGPIELPSFAELTLIGVEGAEVTTIDGGGSGAVYVRSATLTMSGFRLTGTGEDLDWTTDIGGAITTQEGDLTVRDCVISGVTGPYALVFDEEHLWMEDVVWEDNTTDYLWFLYQGTSATFVRNTVRGGVHQAVLASPDLTGLTLTNSTFSDITIDTAFTAFSFAGDGEGELVVTNNVFHDVDDLDPWGGRLFSGAADFRNNVVVGCDTRNLEPFGASYSVFWDNGVDYAPTLTGGGNLFVDPLLVDPASGDFGLQPASPAIDAGDPGGAWQDPDGSRNDMGAAGGPDAG